jgi:hypothetical protein
MKDEEQISELQVMSTPAGYYIGRFYYDKDLHTWLPYDRQSNYFKRKHQAEEHLQLMKLAEEVLQHKQ